MFSSNNEKPSGESYHAAEKKITNSFIVYQACSRRSVSWETARLKTAKITAAAWRGGVRTGGRGESSLGLSLSLAQRYSRIFCRRFSSRS